MILAGIDEAGYGPLLGPLVVGCCAFKVNGAADADGPLPCLWTALNKLVSKKRDRTGKRLHVNDSKAVYTPAVGLKELERSLLALAGAWAGPSADLSDLLRHVAPQVIEQLAEYPWYAAPDGEPFPLEQQAGGINVFASALKAEMARAGSRCVRLAARVVPERQLNRLFQQTRNKSNVLFSLSAIHLDYLLRNFEQQGLVIFCDRQGGREHYGPPLRQLFEEWSLEITAESSQRAEYKLTRGGHSTRIIFCEKAEAQCLPVAVASMLSKYLREALMRRFNAYWQSLQPGVMPTAGYHTDGTRFLRDIDATRRALDITDEQLIRSR